MARFELCSTTRPNKYSTLCRQNSMTNGYLGFRMLSNRIFLWLYLLHLHHLRSGQSIRRQLCTTMIQLIFLYLLCRVLLHHPSIPIWMRILWLNRTSTIRGQIWLSPSTGTLRTTKAITEYTKRELCVLPLLSELLRKSRSFSTTNERLLTTQPTITIQKEASTRISRQQYTSRTHEKQHTGYHKVLSGINGDPSLEYLYQRNPVPTDSRGCYRYQKKRLLLLLENELRQHLAATTPTQWMSYLHRFQMQLSLLGSMQPKRLHTSQTYTANTDNDMGKTVSSLSTTMHPIGTGIDHLASTHRLQLRQQRALRFRAASQLPCAPSLRQHGSTDGPLLSVVHSLAQFTPTPLARPDLFAPPLRQQQQFTAYFRDPLSNAPSLEQHLSVYHFPNPLLPKNEIAPTFFRLQHSINPCNIVAPPAFSLGSLTNPDGPSNILLFDLNTALACESLGNLCDTLIGISNLLFFPYSHWLFSCFDPPGHRWHMGNQLGIYEGISNQVYFPHALVFNSGSIPCINEFQNNNQETVTRAKQKPGQWPTCPIGPGPCFHFDPTRVRKNTTSNGPHSLHMVSSFIRPFRPPPHHMLSCSSLWTILCGDQHWHESDSALQLWTALLWDISTALSVHYDFTSSQAPLDSRSYGRCTDCTYEELDRYSCTGISEDYYVHRSSGCNSPPFLTTFISPECQSKPPFTTQESVDSPHSLLSFTTYGLSFSQLQTLLHNHHLHQCILFPHLMDWLSHLSHLTDSTGIFYYNHHWYTYTHSQRQIQVLVSSRQDPLLPLLTTLIQALPCFSTFSLTLYFAPPTPRGLCGLTAISVLQYLLQFSTTTFPMVQRNGNALFWNDMSAISELHSLYESFLEITNKHFMFGPVGYMETTESSDLEDNVFNTTDTMSPSLPSLLSNTFGIPLIPPNFSHEPITYCLHLTDSELADQLDFGSFLEQRIVYFHFDQSLHMDCFHLQDTTPPETFSSKWEEIYPCYPSSYIQKLMLWDNFLQTWTPSSSALIDTISTNCHLRIHFHTKWVHIDIPLIKRSVRVEITPLWTIQHIVDTLRNYLRTL